MTNQELLDALDARVASLEQQITSQAIVIETVTRALMEQLEINELVSTRITEASK